MYLPAPNEVRTRRRPIGHLHVRPGAPGGGWHFVLASSPPQKKLAALVHSVRFRSHPALKTLLCPQRPQARSQHPTAPGKESAGAAGRCPPFFFFPRVWFGHWSGVRYDVNHERRAGKRRRWLGVKVSVVVWCASTIGAFDFDPSILPSDCSTVRSTLTTYQARAHNDLPRRTEPMHVNRRHETNGDWPRGQLLIIVSSGRRLGGWMTIHVS